MPPVERFQYSWGVRRLHFPLMFVGGLPLLLYICIFIISYFPSAYSLLLVCAVLFIAYSYATFVYDLLFVFPLEIEVTEGHLRCQYILGNHKTIPLNDIDAVVEMRRGVLVTNYEIKITSSVSKHPIGISRSLPRYKLMIDMIKNQNPRCSIDPSLIS